jgi:hypothetical protein
MLGNPLVAERLVVSQEGLISMQLVSYLVDFLFVRLLFVKYLSGNFKFFGPICKSFLKWF